MVIDSELTRWFAAQPWGEVVAQHPLGGGDINEAYKLLMADGTELFLKQHPQPPVAMFQREAEGLDALRAGDIIRIPEVYQVGDRYLLLEYIAPGTRQQGYWETLGQQLAALHQHHGPHFGFPHDNYCGLTPQKNPPYEDGFEFFAEYRLNDQARRARDQGLLTEHDVRTIERVGERLPNWIPVQPPSLIHGDLWSGNIHTGAAGEPVLIDPAAHWGWAEAELAMTQLFGAFPEAFYRAYEACHPLAPGWHERLDLYNLYHLLNHLNLFGSAYLGAVRRICERYG